MVDYVVGLTVGLLMHRWLGGPEWGFILGAWIAAIGISLTRRKMKSWVRATDLPHKDDDVLVCASCKKTTKPPVVHLTVGDPVYNDARDQYRTSAYRWWTLPEGWLVTGARDYDEPERYACSSECASAFEESERAKMESK